MFSVCLRVFHKGCWGSEISVLFPELAFSSVDCRWLGKRVSHLLVARGDSSLFDGIVAYLRKRHDVKTVEELYRSSDSLCVRTVTENSRGHPSFSNLFFEAGCIPLAPTRFEGKFEVWTIGGKEKNAVSSAIDKLRKRYEVSIGWVKSASNYASIKLTTRQREALLTAHELGYFTWPRRITATEVAKATHIPKTVFLSHLRKAENKVIESFALRLT